MLGRFGRLGNEVESFRINGGIDPSLRTATLTVIYGNGEPVENARIELWDGDTLVSVVYTDKDGKTRIRGSKDKQYTLCVSGSTFEGLEIKDFEINSTEIVVSENPYLDLYPTFINLMKGNNYCENVNVRSNREWELS